MAKLNKSEKPTLVRNHREQLNQSAISREVREARGYRSVTSPTTLERFGFSPSQSKLVSKKNPGLLIPGYDVFGENTRFQLRPDEPRLDKKGKPLKYENPPGVHLALDVNPLALDDVTGSWRKPLWITEGIKKADALVSARQVAMALYSVTGFRGTDDSGNIRRLPDWEEIPLSGKRVSKLGKAVGRIQKRRVYIVFDSDVVRKSEVKLALERLYRFLERKADVKLLYLEDDGEKKIGVDDYLAGDGSLDELIEDATDEPRRLELPEMEYHLTDTGNARRMVEMHGDRIRYCPAHKAWYIWNGQIWARDETLEIVRLAKETIRSMSRQAIDIEDLYERKQAVKHCLESERTARINAMIENARSEVVVEPQELDANEYRFCAENGTINLKTGKLLPHSPADFITLMAPTEYRRNAKDDRWEELLDRFVRQDEGKEQFLQRAAYASLVGTISDKAFLNLYDEQDGNTGKTTFIESLLAVLGPYGAIVNAESFLANRGATDRIRSDLAACYGKRMVVSSEIPPGRQLDTTLMKKLTAGFGKFRWERKYENSWEGPITFTIWLDGNTVAKARVEDNPLFDRWKLTPFKHRIEKPDRKWLEKAAASPEFRAAVLAWVMKGRKPWLKEGIGSAPSIDEATAQVRASMDPLSMFWAEECRIGKDEYFATTAQLRDALSHWYARVGSPRPINDRDFFALLKAKGVKAATKRIDGKVTKGWQGIRLRRK